MKTTMKKSLAILLATLMLLGVGAVSASAEPRKPQPSLRAASMEDPTEGTLEILTPGKAQVTINGASDWSSRDFSGLVLQASGGALAEPQTIRYDDLYKDECNTPQVGKIVWNVYIHFDWDAQPNGWQLGANLVNLAVEGHQYTAFTPSKTVDGVDGTFEQEFVFNGSVPMVVTGVDDQQNSDPSKENATALTLGVPANLNGTDEGEWFKFTPTASGAYQFKSTGARDRDDLLTVDGEQQSFESVDPWAQLSLAAIGLPAIATAIAAAHSIPTTSWSIKNSKRTKPTTCLRMLRTARTAL